MLLQVIEGSFIKENVDELCWTLTAKKNYHTDRTSSTVLPEKDAFRLWCLFNFLSEDKYPLVMVPDEVGRIYFNFHHKTDTLYISMLLGTWGISSVKTQLDWNFFLNSVVRLSKQICSSWSSCWSWWCVMIVTLVTKFSSIDISGCALLLGKILRL